MLTGPAAMVQAPSISHVSKAACSSLMLPMPWFSLVETMPGGWKGSASTPNITSSATWRLFDFCWRPVLTPIRPCSSMAQLLSSRHVRRVTPKSCVCCWKLVQTKTKLVTMDQQQCSQLAPRATSKLFNYSSRRDCSKIKGLRMSTIEGSASKF